MALVYSYTNFISNPSIGTIRKQRTKAEKAMLKRRLPQNMIDAFLDGIENDRQVRSACVSLTNAVREGQNKVLGAETLNKHVMKSSAKSKALTKVFTQVVSKQLAVKFRDVHCEIHVKASKLQLWIRVKGGTDQVLYEWKSGAL